MADSLKIALADDKPQDASFLRRELSELGHRVLSTSTNGKQLVKQCRLDRPDLVITGIKMPKMDGIQASVEICRDEPLPIIFVSAYYDPELIARALDDHVLAYLVKPVKRPDLETSIALVMRRFADFQALRQQAQELKDALKRVKKLDRVRMSIAELENQSHSVAHPKDASNKQVKKLHRATADRHRSLLETIPHGIQEIDTAGNIMFSNDACCRLHGFRPGELQGKTIWQLLASNREQHTFREALERRITSQPAPASYTTRHRTKDNRLIDVQIDWTYKRDEQGEVAGFVSIITDISERKRTEEALKVARNELELQTKQHNEKLSAADQSLQQEIARRQQIEAALRRSERLTSIGILAAGIAHEINNPVVAALNSAETALAVKDQPDSGGMMEDCLINIIESSKRCGDIITNVLRFASQEPTQKERHCLNRILKKAVRIAGSIVDKANSDLTIELPDQRLDVLINPLEIEVVVANLLQNALQATVGKTPVHIRLRSFRTSTEACFEVHDDGCGIPDSDLAHIFDPFYTTRKEAGGTGLGLSIVYSIIHEHGGVVEARSQMGTGTTISVHLPLAPEDSNT